MAEGGLGRDAADSRLEPGARCVDVDPALGPGHGWGINGESKRNFKNAPQTQAAVGMLAVVFPFPSGCSSRTRTPCGGKS